MCPVLLPASLRRSCQFVSWHSTRSFDYIDLGVALGVGADSFGRRTERKNKGHATRAFIFDFAQGKAGEGILPKETREGDVDLRVRDGVWVARGWDVAADEGAIPTPVSELAGREGGGDAYRSNSYARSLARVLGWKPLTNRILAILCVWMTTESEELKHCQQKSKVYLLLFGFRGVTLLFVTSPRLSLSKLNAPMEGR